MAKRKALECPDIPPEVMNIVMEKLRGDESYASVVDYLNIYYGIEINRSDFLKCYPQLKKKTLLSKMSGEAIHTDEELKRKVLEEGVKAEDVVDWMEEHIKVMSKFDGGVIDYTYTGREFYIDIHRDYVNPNHDTIVLKSRQVEASTSFIDVMLYLLMSVPSFTVAHVFPSEIKATKFSKEKINEFFFYNPYFAERIAKETSNSVFDKALYNDAGISWYRMTYVGGRKSEDIRSMSVDVLGIDEYDDFPEGSMGALLGSTLHSPFGKRIYLFTPKLPTSLAYKHWEHSTQNKWYFVCEHCGAPNNITLENIKKVGDEYKYVCNACGEELTKKVKTYRDENGLLQVDKTTGFWKPDNPDGEIEGYFVNQMMLPYLSAKKIMDYKNDPNLSKREFYNEVLGIPYAGEEMPVTADMLWKITNPDLEWGKPPKGTVQKVMGVDWGGKSNYVKVAKLRSGEYVLYDGGVIYGSAQEHMNFVMRELEKDPSLIVIVDRGYDAGRTARLQSAYGDRVWGVVYQGEKRAVWTTDKYKGTDVRDYKIVINHQIMVDSMVELIKSGELSFACPSEVRVKVKNIIENMTLVTLSIVSTKKNMVEVQKISYDTNRAHYFMALMYALLHLHFKAEANEPIAYIKKKEDGAPRNMGENYIPFKATTINRFNKRRNKIIRRW